MSEELEPRAFVVRSIKDAIKLIGSKVVSKSMPHEQKALFDALNVLDDYKLVRIDGTCPTATNSKILKKSIFRLSETIEYLNDIFFREHNPYHMSIDYEHGNTPMTLGDLNIIKNALESVEVVDVFTVPIEEINKAGNIRTKAEFKRILKGGGFWLSIGNANKVVLTEDHLSENYTSSKGA